MEHHNHDREFTEVNGERFDRERIAEGAKLVVEWLEVQAGSLGKAYEISERFNRLGLTSVEAVVALFLAPAIRRAVYDDPEREARDLNVWASEQARLVDWGTLTAARRHRLMLWGMFPGLKIPPGVINSMGGPSPEATEADAGEPGQPAPDITGVPTDQLLARLTGMLDQIAEDGQRRMLHLGLARLKPLAEEWDRGWDESEKRPEYHEGREWGWEWVAHEASILDLYRFKRVAGTLDKARRLADLNDPDGIRYEIAPETDPADFWGEEDQVENRDFVRGFVIGAFEFWSELDPYLRP